ncbi:MAG TPA: hypothetical protein VIR03_01270, partial [Candidatus Saccharimonadales bacterium]
MNNDDTNPQPNKPQAPPASAFGPDKKVFDVMRPGKAPASPTSRPVVIGHKPQVHDDQLVPSADTRYASNNPLDEKRDLLTHKGGVDFASPGAADEYPDDPPGDNKPASADASALGTQKELAAMGALASQIDKGEEQASADT